MEHPHKNIKISGSDYDFEQLCGAYPELRHFVFENKYQSQTIDFSDPKAVKALNKALLFFNYKISFWDFPDDNLCPPIPGRMAYIKELALLLKQSNIDKNSRILDIGTGATCIYPLLGHAAYGWQFVGSDIDTDSLKVAQNILVENGLTHAIQLRQQKDASQILTGIVMPEDRFCVTLCNPPFYKDEEEAIQANLRKIKGLGKGQVKVLRNFSGSLNELCYRGGEKAFLHNYLYQSSLYKSTSFWFTSLVSKKENVKAMKSSLEKLGATEIKVIEMRQSHKISRIVAWTFLNKKEQKNWTLACNS